MRTKKSMLRHTLPGAAVAVVLCWGVHAAGGDVVVVPKYLSSRGGTVTGDVTITGDFGVTGDVAVTGDITTTTGVEAAGACSTEPTGDVCCHDNQGVRCGKPETDAAADPAYLYGYSASPIGSTAGNRTGGTTVLAGGLGTRLGAMSVASCDAAASTITITIDADASPDVGTEGTDFVCIAVTDAVCATNVAVWLNTLAGIDACAGAGCTDFTGVAGTWYLWRTTARSVTIATNDALCAALTSGSDGPVRIHAPIHTMGPIYLTDTAEGNVNRITRNTDNRMCFGASTTACSLDIDANKIATGSQSQLEINAEYSVANSVIAADDTTPTIASASFLTTSGNTVPTAITDLDNTVAGQMVYICGGSDTNSSTIADSGNFNLSAAMTLGLDDCISLRVQADNDYIELGRSVN